jgi:hypothetical protein
MPAEIPEFNIPWRADYIGSLPDLSGDRLNYGANKLTQTQTDYLHDEMRAIKNLFVDLPPGVDPKQLALLQKRAEVSIVADLMRAAGYDIPFTVVPYSGDLVPEQKTMGISTTPIMLAERYGTNSGTVFANQMLMSFRKDPEMLSQALESDWPPGAASSMDAVINNFVLDVGILSQGVPTGFRLLASRLNTMLKEGMISEVDMIQRLNDNFGIAALKRMGPPSEKAGGREAEIKAGISLHLLDRIFENWSQPNFELWICDDVVVGGATLRVMGEYLRDEATRRGFSSADLDKFMGKFKFFTDNGFQTGFKIESGEYRWEIKETGILARDHTVRVGRPEQSPKEESNG